MLPDVQDEVDVRGISLDEVGISGLRYPTEFTDGATRQAGIATFDVLVTLPSDRRGTHMSRMVQLVQEQLGVIDPRELPLVMKQVATRMDIDRALVRVSLPVATTVISPVSGLKAFQTSDLHLSATIESGSFELTTSITAQVTSLCPCSKTISDYGAHNQRSDVKVSVSGTHSDPYPINLLVVWSVSNLSSDTYSVVDFSSSNHAKRLFVGASHFLSAENNDHRVEILELRTILGELFPLDMP